MLYIPLKNNAYESINANRQIMESMEVICNFCLYHISYVMPIVCVPETGMGKKEVAVILT